jgi:hypothetical protein
MSNNASPRIAYDSLALGRLVVRHARYRPGHLAVVVPSGTAASAFRRRSTTCGSSTTKDGLTLARNDRGIGGIDV